MSRLTPHHDTVLHAVNSQLSVFGTGQDNIAQITPSIVFWHALDMQPQQYGYFSLDKPIEKFAEHSRLAKRAKHLSGAVIQFTSCFELLGDDGSKTVLVNPHHTPLHVRGEDGVASMASRIIDKPDARFMIGGDTNKYNNNRHDGYSLLSYAQQTEAEIRKQRMQPEMIVPVYRTLLQALRNGVPYTSAESAIKTFQNKAPTGKLRKRY